MLVGQINVSNKLANHIKLPLRPHSFIKSGARVVKTRLEICEEPGEKFKVSTQLAEALYLHSIEKLKLRYDQVHDVLHIGPTIGILTSAIPQKEKFNANSTQAELIYLSNVGKTLNAQIYIFTPQSIDWENLSTIGYVYKYGSDKQGVWEASVYPLPDVVYDRISSRKAEALVSIKKTKRRLMNLPDLKYFNQSFFNKWRVNELLASNHSLSCYLPETRMLNNENLREMLQKHKELYIKPANGSQGHGIIKTTNKGDGRIHYTAFRNGRQNGSADSVYHFMAKTEKFRRKRTYIVQQGIDLAKYKESPFDIRIIYQKNGDGKWIISKKFIRVAARGSSISNLSKGGRPEQSKTVLGQVFSKNKNLIAAKNREMRNLCETVANTMEKTSESLLGELGLDIGIDTKGKLWLIEVNSKPRKTTETEMSKDIVRNTFKRPLEYGIYLSGFRNDK